MFRGSSEYHIFIAALKRIEERLDKIESVMQDVKSKIVSMAEEGIQISLNLDEATGSGTEDNPIVIE